MFTECTMRIHLSQYVLHLIWILLNETPSCVCAQTTSISFLGGACLSLCVCVWHVPAIRRAQWIIFTAVYLPLLVSRFTPPSHFHFIHKWDRIWFSDWWKTTERIQAWNSTAIFVSLCTRVCVCTDCWRCQALPPVARRQSTKKQLHFGMYAQLHTSIYLFGGRFCKAQFTMCTVNRVTWDVNDTSTQQMSSLFWKIHTHSRTIWARATMPHDAGQNHEPNECEESKSDWWNGVTLNAPGNGAKWF